MLEKSAITRSKNLPVHHLDYAVGDGGEVFVMGNDDDGLPILLAQVQEQAVEFLLVGFVKAACGLVGKDDRGRHH